MRATLLLNGNVMAIQLTSQFEANFNSPLNKYSVVQSITERDALLFRHEGLTVYVKDDQSEYQLRGGTTNAHWVKKSTTGGIQGVSKFLGETETTELVTAIPAMAMMSAIIINNNTLGSSPIINIGETLAGTEIYEGYEVDQGFSVIDFKKVYTTNQSLHITGNFTGATLDFYIIYTSIS